MVGVTFIKRNHAESDEPLQPHERNHDLQNMNGLPLIDHVNVTGPYNPTGPGDTPSRRRVFTSAKPGAGRVEGEPPARGRSCRRSPPRLSPAGHRAPTSTPILERSTTSGAQEGHVRQRHRAGRCG